MTDTSRRFTLVGLSHSAAHHLDAVAELLDARGYARVSDIGRALGVTRGSVCVVMQSLRRHGYVDQDQQHFYHLTDRGSRAAASIQARHRIVERFLVKVLGLSPDQSHQESCKLENLLTAPTARRLMKLLEFWEDRRLADDFEAGLDEQCPACAGQDSEECPCCGLECLDGTCSMKA